jgi:hypothetical protein
MKCTPREVQILMRYSKTHGREGVATKAAMSLRTARKYLKAGGQMSAEQAYDLELYTSSYSILKTRKKAAASC